MAAETERAVQAGDVVQIVGSMEPDGKKLIGTTLDPWYPLAEWWNIMLSTGQIIQWPTSQLKILSPNLTAKQGN